MDLPKPAWTLTCRKAGNKSKGRAKDTGAIRLWYGEDTLLWVWSTEPLQLTLLRSPPETHTASEPNKRKRQQASISAAMEISTAANNNYFQVGKARSLGVCNWLKQVIEEKKWREVIAAFKFPPTTTSASFVLRRYYLSLLHHYEQVYYFRTQGPLIPPADTPMFKETHLSLISAGPYNFTVTGSIDGKFEHGYMVTVKIGSEMLRGVLYHVQTPSSAASSSLAAAVSAAPEASNEHRNAAMARTRRRRKRGWRCRDPAHPKSNRSAYNFFFAEKHSKLKVLYPHREREFSKMIGESWNKLNEEERMVAEHFFCNNYGLEDKERYKREMQEYKERLKLVQPKEMAGAEPSSKAASEQVKGGASADGH
ncbi:hypothetical protein BHM03_00001338 [Ensete ventricosum]|nr:hypothetical protein BHM03_00001338 [Ensete ventricosum]